MDKLLKESVKKKDLLLDNMAKLSQIAKNNKKTLKEALQFENSIKPQVFYCRHMEIGVAGYEDETIFIGLDAIKKMMPSFNGCPVYVFHVDDVDYNDIGSKADGFVTECFYNEKDGWIWAKFIVTTPEGLEAINKGWSVSNAYIPTEWGAGGKWHNVDYNRKITDGEFTHLALVPNPRYEEAKVFSVDEFKNYQAELTNQLKQLHNSKQGEKKMFKIFKNTREEVTEITEDTMIELDDGSAVSFGELKNAVIANEAEKEKENADEDEKVNMDSIVEVGEEKMPLKELVNKYKNMCKKANEEDEKENAEEEDEKKNEEEKKGEEEEKKNALEADKQFKELKNAHKASDTPIQLSSDMIARGKARYGSGN